MGGSWRSGTCILYLRRYAVHWVGEVSGEQLLGNAIDRDIGGPNDIKVQNILRNANGCNHSRDFDQ